MIQFLYCACYLAALGILSFVLGRLVPKAWFDYRRAPYRTAAWEKDGRIYETLLHVSAWQTRVPDMSRIFPGLMPAKKMVRLDTQSLLTMIRETCVAEAVHWILAILGAGVLVLWPTSWGVLLYLLYAIFGNLIFIIIQRYNRPRLVRLYERQQQKRRNQV